MSKLLATSPRDIYEVAVTLTENVTHCSQAPGSVRYASRSVPTHELNAHNFLLTLCIALCWEYEGEARDEFTGRFRLGAGC